MPFAANVICGKNYSFSTVYSGVNFLFFQCKTANSFYSKINDSKMDKTIAFSSSRFGVRVAVVPNFSTLYPQHFSIPEFSELLKDSPTNFFGTVRQKFSTEYLDIPPPSYPNSFGTRNYCNSKGFPTEIFGSVRQKIVDGKS